MTRDSFEPSPSPKLTAKQTAVLLLRELGLHKGDGTTIVCHKHIAAPAETQPPDNYDCSWFFRGKYEGSRARRDGTRGVRVNAHEITYISG